MRGDIDWSDVVRYVKQQRESAIKELLGCELERVERIRGRIEAYDALLNLPKRSLGRDAVLGDL